MSLTKIQLAELAAAGFADLQIGEQLCKGTSNKNFRARAQGKDWVLRINNPLTQSLCPRDNEVACWRQATAAGIAPVLVFVSNDYGLYLSHYVAQPLPWDQCYQKHPHALTLLNTLLAKLAELPRPSHKTTPAQQWAYYQGELTRRRSTLSPQLAEVADNILDEKYWVEASLARLADNSLEKFCHRDLNPDNLLLHNQQLLCIDFEYACSSDPRFEIAALLACHKMNSVQSRQLKQQHLLGSPQQQALDYADASYCYWVFTACWGIIMCDDGKAAISWLREALGHLHHHKSRLLV